MVSSDGADHQRVAVRIGVAEHVGAEHRHAAGPVVDHDRLAEPRAHRLGVEAAEHVDQRPAGVVMIRWIGRDG